jgi:hypothetical protein
MHGARIIFLIITWFKYIAKIAFLSYVLLLALQVEKATLFECSFPHGVVLMCIDLSLVC